MWMTSQKVKKILCTDFSATPYYPTIADCIRWTEVLNHIMFHGTLPKWRKITVRQIRKNWAWCVGHTSPVRKKKSCELIINNKFPSFAAFYSVLAHELCHVAEYHELEELKHGKFFYSHKEMLAQFGIRLSTCC
jgi:hypothetical protein